MHNHEIDHKNLEAWNQRLFDLQTSYSEALSILETAEAMNYQKGIAESCKTLGYCFWRFSDFSLSLSHSLRAIKIFQKLKDKKGEADTLNNIGAVYMFQNDNKKRLEVNLKCKELRAEIGDLEGVISSEGNIGETYFEMGDYENAQLCFETVINSKDASPQGLAWAYHNLGMVYKFYENWDTSLEFYKKGLEISESVNYNVLITDSYLKIAELFVELNNLDNALLNTEKALAVSRKIGAKDGEKRALFYLSKIFELKGLFEVSLKYHKDFHTIDLEISRDTEMEKLKTTQLKVAFDKIEEQKDELIDSIRYAEKIQKAVLTRHQNKTLIGDYFTFYNAKDIVSGDFYWYYEKDDFFYACVADCTGHGVPGAFLTMLGTTYLNEIITINGLISPSELLDKLREHIIEGLSQNSISGNKDGMDISLLRINSKTLKAEWAGANSPIWIIQQNNNVFETNSMIKRINTENYSLIEIKGDIQSISIMEKMYPFTNHSFQLTTKDRIYLFSDGYVDQFGGNNGKKLMTLKFKEFLLSIQNESMEKQGDYIENHFNNWKGQYEQVDDVCVFGIEI